MKTKLILFVLSLMSVLSLSAKTPDAVLPEVSFNQEAAVSFYGQNVCVTGYGLPSGELLAVYVFNVNGVALTSQNMVSENGTIMLLVYLSPGPYFIRAVTEGGVEYFGRFLYTGGSKVDVILKRKVK